MDEILTAKAGEGDAGGVDVTAYRAKNPDKWPILDQLEKLQFIRRDNSVNRYFVSLLGLVRLKSKFATEFRKQAETIYAHLRAEYGRDHTARVTLADLSKITGLSVDEVGAIVRHMIEASIWSGHNLGNRVTTESYVIGNEKVVDLAFPHFSDVVAELESYRAMYQGQTAVPYSAADVISDYAMPAAGPPQQSRQSTKYKTPDWHKRIPMVQRRVMKEVHIAAQHKASMIAVMGLRAAIDLVLTDRVGNDGRFDERLQRLLDKRDITPEQHNALNNALEVGHASAHRGHIPSMAEVAKLRNIVEHLLRQVYTLGPDSVELAERVPKRPRKTK
ncbi:MAG: hypothetical protein KGO02_12575 [Alphaproteobacteria bacterium]|nr:hypothetical protein [Alphaproteobacteria bacterium]